MLNSRSKIRPDTGKLVTSHSLKNIEALSAPDYKTLDAQKEDFFFTSKGKNASGLVQKGISWLLVGPVKNKVNRFENMVEHLNTTADQDMLSGR